LGFFVRLGFMISVEGMGTMEEDEEIEGGRA
jgi:hypothetical protein